MIELDKFTIRVMNEREKVFEERFTILLQDRPKWLPLILWNKIVRRLLVIQSEFIIQ